MSLIKAEYNWIEKKDSIKISFPLKGVSVKKVDIFVSTRSLKVNFAPYILDIVLWDEVDSVHHKAIVRDGVLQITLFKVHQTLWGKCEAVGDKEELKEVKDRALQSQEQLEAELKTKRTDRKVDEERTSVRKQMALEEEVRTRLENLQQEEKSAAEKEVYETFAKIQEKEVNKTETKKPFLQSIIASKAKEIPKEAEQRKAEKDIFADDDIEEEGEETDPPLPLSPPASQSNDHQDAIFEEEDIRYIPPPRAVEAKVAIKHTPRFFPTPMRESKLAEEEDWIAKNRQHLKKHGVLGKNVNSGKDVTEEDPVWLKAKGDDFLRGGDVQSALNAYSAAIDADSNFTPCYANRATCYLKLGLFAQCKTDCDVVIAKTNELLSSLSPAEKEEGKDKTEHMKLLSSLVKAYIRRGAALCQLGQFNDSLSDYCQALSRYQLLTGGAISQLGNISIQSIQSDIDQLKLLCSVETLKKEGDRLFGEQELREALEKYTAALSLLPVHVSSLSNRSACKIALGDIEGAIEDCQRAVKLLQISSGSGRPAGETYTADMLTAVLPPPNSVKRKQWLLKTLLRQAMALVQVDRINQAIGCYEHALELEPKDQQIAADLKKLKEMQGNDRNHISVNRIEKQ